MAQTPPSPTVLQIRKFLSNAGDTYFEDEDADNRNGPPSTAVGCHVCNAIFHGFTAPVQGTCSYDLGTVNEVMSSPCDAHKALITWFIGYWDDEGFTDHTLSIFKHAGNCFLELLRDDTLYLPFELIGGYSCNTSNLNTSGVEESIVSSEQQHARIFGRGQILDEHWIRFDMIKRWSRMCRNEHGAACNSPSFSQDLNARPVYFIDTQDNCIVPATSTESYVALSYVWGRVSSLRLEEANAKILTSPGALRQEGIIERITLTILHAIDFARLLGERYLWVDSLCIVQDGNTRQKQEQLNNMTAIYANANITIIAASGSDAAYGLRGIRDVSRPVQRNVCQEYIPFPPYGSVVERIFRAKNERREDDPINPYYRRGWKFQEYFYSKRRIIFEKETVFWSALPLLGLKTLNARTEYDSSLLATYFNIKQHLQVLCLDFTLSHNLCGSTTRDNLLSRTTASLRWPEHYLR